MNNIPIEVTPRFNEMYIYNNDSVITCSSVIMSVVNKFKNIYLSNNCFTKFQSTLFQNKDVIFSYYFKQYIENTVDNIHHPKMINEWKSNMYKA